MFKRKNKEVPLDENMVRFLIRHAPFDERDSREYRETHPREWDHVGTIFDVQYDEWMKNLKRFLTPELMNQARQHYSGVEIGVPDECEMCHGVSFEVEYDQIELSVRPGSAIWQQQPALRKDHQHTFVLGIGEHINLLYICCNTCGFRTTRKAYGQNAG